MIWNPQPAFGSFLQTPLAQKQWALRSLVYLKDRLPATAPQSASAVRGAVPVVNLSVLWLDFTGGKHGIVLKNQKNPQKTTFTFWAAAVMCLTIWQFDLKTYERTIYQSNGGQKVVSQLLNYSRERQAVILWQRIRGTNSVSNMDWNQLKFKGDFSDITEDFIHLKLFKGPGEYISSSNVA